MASVVKIKTVKIKTAKTKTKTSVLKKQFLRKSTLKIWGRTFLSIFTALIVFACAYSSEPLDLNSAAIAPKAPETLIILWDKGYVVEEDEAIEQVVKDWEAQGGYPVDLSFYNSGETAPRTLRASKSGQLPPDILFTSKSVYPVSDWEGKLADVTEVVAPYADSYGNDVLQAAKVYGSEKAKDRYYAVPLNQSTTHIYYWKDLLQEAGYQPEDIPTDWDGFWSFWQTVQSRLSKQYPDIRGLGLPYSVAAMDTCRTFEHVLSAYNVQLVDERGNLRLDEPNIRSGLVQSLNWYAQFYKNGYVPNNAVDWLDPDNNRNLLNRRVVMTPNPSLSIPAAVRNDPEIYFNQLGTVAFPNKPNGEPLMHFVDIRQAIVFSDSLNQQAAKDFLAYLTQPAVLDRFLKTSYGRFMPPSKNQIKADSFWQDSADPHISTVVKTVVAGQTQPFYNAYNPAYGTVMEENVWGQVIHAMAVENLSAEAAADRAIAQIKTIFRKTS
jgi:multiple sugar transport system substrate-binding protein